MDDRNFRHIHFRERLDRILFQHDLRGIEWKRGIILLRRGFRYAHRVSLRAPNIGTGDIRGIDIGVGDLGKRFGAGCHSVMQFRIMQFRKIEFDVTEIEFEAVFVEGNLFGGCRLFGCRLMRRIGERRLFDDIELRLVRLGKSIEDIFNIGDRRLDQVIRRCSLRLDAPAAGGVTDRISLHLGQQGIEAVIVFRRLRSNRGTVCLALVRDRRCRMLDRRFHGGDLRRVIVISSLERRGRNVLNLGRLLHRSGLEFRFREMLAG
jgi:hypothetical protein